MRQRHINSIAKFLNIEETNVKYVDDIYRCIYDCSEFKILIIYVLDI